MGEVKMTIDEFKALHDSVEKQKAWLTDHAENLISAASQVTEAVHGNQYHHGESRYDSYQDMSEHLDALLAKGNEFDAAKNELGVASVEFRS